MQYEFIERPKTTLAASYAKFQKLSQDLDSGTIEDEIPISLLIQASKKDDMTWAEARVSGEFNLFKAAAREEISSLEKKESWVVVKRSSVKSNILPSTWASGPRMLDVSRRYKQTNQRQRRASYFRNDR